MFAKRFFVEPDPGAVISGAEVEKDVRAWRRVICEGLLVPNRAFVILQLRSLKVPVTGHAQSWRSIETVFDKVSVAVRFSVQVITARPALVILIDEIVPVTIQRDGLAGGDILD